MASCGKCKRQWTGANQAHCASGCHRHFSTVALFDRHRAGGDGCQDPASLTDKHGRPVMEAFVNRFGTTWKGPDRRDDSGNAGEPSAASEDAA